jgi:integrase
MPELTVVQPKAPSAIGKLVDDYLSWCRARGLSPKTIKEGYGYPLRNVLLPFCGREEITKPGQLSSRILDRLTSELLEQGGKRGALSKHSVHSYARAINHFLAWAHKEGEIGPVRAQTPKLPKKIVDVLSREEISQLEDTALNERDKLIIRILADTGVRVGELIGLRVSDLIERDRNYYLHVRGKGARDRLVPIPRLSRRVLRFAERGRPHDARTDRLFVGLRRRPGGDYEALTASGVGQVVRTLGEVAGVRKRVYPHVLRHSYATYALTRGMNPVQLAQILGHSSLSMIQNVYSHLSPHDAYEAMAKVLLADEDK